MPMSNPKAERTMLFMRHGETTSNVKYIASGGDRDPPLTDRGQQQAVEAIEMLERHGELPDVIVTSPLKRAADTAAAVSAHFNLKVSYDHNLRERMLGDWNGQSSSIINPLLKQGDTPPNGESRPEFRKRSLEGLQQASLRGQRPLVIASRGTARILLEIINHSDPLNFPNGGIMRILINESNSLEAAQIDILS